MNDFQKQLRDKMDRYARLVYNLTKNFPREEMFGMTSQFRRAALSVVLNYIEGLARESKKNNLAFLDISYGSFKESKYLLHFCFCEGYINKNDYEKALKLAEEVGAMPWSTIQLLRTNV